MKDDIWRRDEIESPCVKLCMIHPRRHDAARTVILEAAPDQHLVVGEKRRGQRVAREAAHPLAVEGEVDGAAAVDQPSAPCETRAHL